MSLVTFKERYLSEIEQLFLREVFFNNPDSIADIISEGILNVVNELSDYHEEGKYLSPEIIVVSSTFYLKKQFPHLQIVPIGEFTLSPSTIQNFDSILKSCAPLAVDQWIIYIEIDEFSSPQKVEFGLLNAMVDELSESIQLQVLSRLDKIQKEELKCVFIQNIGQKQVRLAGLNRKLRILAFSISATPDSPYESIQSLSNSITSKLKGKNRTQAATLYSREINNAVDQGHGTLIGVVCDSSLLDDSSLIGHRLREPINIPGLITKALKTKKPSDFGRLRRNCQLIKAAICNDGITIFSEDGKFLGYHYIIHGDSYIKGAGGARSHAFESMKLSKLFSCCFYKSQDGKAKFWINK